MPCHYCSNKLKKTQKICPKCGKLVKIPFYKSGWMWLLPILVTFTILGIFTPHYDSIKANPPPLAYTNSLGAAVSTISPSISTTLSRGDFVAGEDIHPGRYTITTSQGTGHLSILHSDIVYINEILTSSEKADSTIGVTQIEIDLAKGDLITISGLKKVAFSPAPLFQKTNLVSGYHVVGRDVPPGTYTLIVDKGSGNFIVYDKNHVPRINEILRAHPETSIHSQTRVSLYEGELIKITSLDKVNLMN